MCALKVDEQSFLNQSLALNGVQDPPVPPSVLDELERDVDAGSLTKFRNVAFRSVARDSAETTVQTVASTIISRNRKDASRMASPLPREEKAANITERFKRAARKVTPFKPASSSMSNTVETVVTHRRNDDKRMTATRAHDQKDEGAMLGKFQAAARRVIAKDSCRNTVSSVAEVVICHERNDANRLHSTPPSSAPSTPPLAKKFKSAAARSVAKDSSPLSLQITAEELIEGRKQNDSRSETSDKSGASTEDLFPLPGQPSSDNDSSPKARPSGRVTIIDNEQEAKNSAQSLGRKKKPSLLKRMLGCFVRVKPEVIDIRLEAAV